MIRAVLFDLDGTLLDRDASVRKFIRRQHERLHRHVGHIDAEEYCSAFITLDAKGYVWKDRVYAEMAERFGIHGLTPDQLLADYIAGFADSCVPFPNMIRLLDELSDRGIALGMITNGFTAFQMNNIKALGIQDYFRTLLISEREGLRKPDPAIFLRALERLGVTPEDAVFVGDHPVNDVQAAQAVGMKGVWKRDPYYDAPGTADAVIDDLSELPSFLFK
ncbi:Pyrimidine 5'-nucleotidase YjjG [Paenibacillus konkukensis]|uniref:Pyrimidine 5'-nucleotidase YjjG n=1 Tax=Paenibacillus konkukensis TaxID=2020716 RepID=A0ABY4RY55_9BACL|nr:HAD-IA family hydrolase [Paenibacillus konkukensis]UQZ86918.1 Pyrimidine 5'-nucleotidase YjjG [Paenibacillus konkukensis]